MSSTRQEPHSDLDRELANAELQQLARNFAANLRDYFKREGVTQEDFASRAGVSKGAIQNWLKGQFPGAFLLLKVARLCGYSTIDDMVYLPKIEIGRFCVRREGGVIGLYEHGERISFHPIWQMATGQMKDLISSRPAEWSYEI